MYICVYDVIGKWPPVVAKIVSGILAGIHILHVYIISVYMYTFIHVYVSIFIYVYVCMRAYVHIRTKSWANFRQSLPRLSRAF